MIGVKNLLVLELLKIIIKNWRDLKVPQLGKTDTTFNKVAKSKTKSGQQTE